MSDKNAIFEEPLQAWFRALSPEERSAALTVKDGPFVSTLIHFAALSTSLNDDGKAEIDGRGAQEADSMSSCNWNKEILLSDIENVYSSYRERFGMNVESKSSTNLAMRQPSKISSGAPEKMVPNTESNSVERRSGEHLESSKQLSKPSDAVAGDNDADIIHRSRIGSDACRIQGVQEAEGTTGTKYDETAKKESDNNADHKCTAPDSFLRELVLIFPGVLQVGKEHGIQELSGVSKVDGDPSPILSLLPSALHNFDTARLRLQGHAASAGATWLTQLREHVDSTAGPNNESSASLSLMVLSRFHVSATEAFLACKNEEADQLETAQLIATAMDAVEDAVNVEEEQSSFEQYITPPEEEGSDDNESEEMDVATLRLQAPLPSNRVPRKPRRHHSDGSVSTQPAETLCRELCEAVKKFAGQSDYERFAAFYIRESILPLIPLEAVLGFDDDKMLKLNEALKTFLSSVLPRAITTRAEPTKGIEEKTNNLIGVAPEQAEDISTVTFQQSQNGFGKKKKKKKKRKRKNSNADSLASLAGKEVGSPELSKSLASIAAAIALPQTPNLSPRNTKQLPVDCCGVDLPKMSSANSCDSDHTEQSAKDVDAVDAEVTVQQIPTGEESSIAVARTGDARPTGVVVASTESRRSRAEKAVSSAVVEKVDEDGNEWETVEAKGRGKNRNKIESRRDSSYSSQYHHSNSHGSRKVKSGRTSASRRRTANRRIVRDILFSVLDSVDVEGRRRRRAVDARSFEERRRRSGQPRPVASGGGVPQSTSTASSEPVSLRDVVLRKQSVNPKQGIRGQPLPRSRVHHPSPYAGVVRAALNDTHKKITSPDVKSKGTQTQAARADQSTAQTIPETLSGASANTQSSLATEEVDNVSDKLGRHESGNAVLIDDTNSAVNAGDEQEFSHVKDVVSTEKKSSPAPPLPTLLGPGNTNSATSSVASSLEAPHASNHRHHHHSSSCKENDVGYHLLDVCDRLSRDMNMFMTRRSLALTARRRERGALLTALQASVSNIWAGHGSVEMYGSCATQLDLPSSDLDAVILGLDAFPSFVVDANIVATTNVVSNEQIQFEPSGTVDSVPSSPISPRSPYSQKNMALSPYGRHSANGERVLLLAAELEKQPWAVQVKAIPTATVPVVKILADPSKLPGAVSSNGSGEDWMLQQHHMAAQAAVAAAGMNPPPLASGNAGFLSAPPLTQRQPSYPPHTPPPWRGADVMNGLFSLDVTFEGPEHGGLGSTVYSANVVQEACNETGLSPEGTPVVQVLMVLKELLAQRRLNEPFSGGLSSYALLLLVNAVAKERTIIREEMERIERHRALVAAENTAIVSSDFAAVASSTESEDGKMAKGAISTLQRQSGGKPSSTPKPAEHINVCISEEISGKVPKPRRETSLVPKKLNSPKNLAPTARVSSWASIAKNSTNSFAPKVAPTSQSTAQKSEEGATESQQISQPLKATSFAEAVSRKQEGSANQEAQKQRGQPPKKEGDQKHTKRVESKKTESKHHKKADSKNSSGAAQTTPKPREKERLHSMSVAALQSPKGQHMAIAKAPQSTSAKWEAKKDAVQHTKPNQFAPLDSSLSGASSLFPQGSNDVLEVLCSGETSAGKLLMHFLLYYGELFESRTNAVDVIGSCNPNRPLGTASSVHLSPYIPRHSGGTIDPITGMLTVDPIIVYDPWEGGVGHNVARSCYAWSSIRWHFAQCYMTLSSAVERGGNTATNPTVLAEASVSRNEAIESTPSTDNTDKDTPNKGNTTGKHKDKTSNSEHPHPVDTVSPLLELLLSF